MSHLSQTNFIYMLEYKYVCHGAAFSYLPLRCVLWLSENFGTISRIALRKSKKKKMKTKERRLSFYFLRHPAWHQAWLEHSPQQKLEWNSAHNFRPSTTAQLHKDCAISLLLFLLCFYWDSFVMIIFIF